MSAQSATFFGYVKHTKAEIAFVLPVFSVKGSENLVIQVPTMSLDRVERFQMVHTVGEGLEVLDVRSPTVSRLGSPLIYAALNRAQILVGPTIEIASELWELANDPRAGSGFVLQVAELCGDLGEKLEARYKNASDIEMKLGSKASSQFVTHSVSLEAIWQLLVSYTRHEKHTELWSRRAQLLHSVNIHDDKIIPDDARNWLSHELGVDVDAVVRDALASLPIDLARRSTANMAKVEFELPADPIGDEIRLIQNESRQELRLAKLIKKLVQNPDFGEKLLDEYKDKAKFANKAVSFLKRNIAHFSREIDSSFAYFLVHNMFKMCYAKQRGILLHEFAVELAEYPKFAEAIEWQLRQSYSGAVKMAKNDIIEQLENPGERRGRVYAPYYYYQPYFTDIRDPNLK